MDEKKDLEIVSGDGSNLNISPAYDHLNVKTPNSSSNKPKNIVIPKAINEESDKNNDKDNSKDEEKKEN